MGQPRLIRYLENGVYRYASVKDVGDLEKLKTTAKADLVSAINELFENGGATNIPDDLVERLEDLEGKLAEQTGKNASQDQTIADQNAKQTATDQAIEDIKTEYELSQADIDLLKRIQEEVKADTVEALQKANDLKEQADQIIIDLAGKVSQLDWQTQYDQIKQDILSKVDEARYQSEYDALILEIKNKVDAIEYQSKVDALNESIASQKTEVEKAKTDITALETKATDIQTQLNTSVESIEGDVTTLQGKIAENETLLNEQGGTITTIQSDLDEVAGQYTLQSQTLSNLNGRMGSAESKITANATEIASRVKQTDFDTLNGKVSSQETTITQHATAIGLKAEKTDVYTKNEADSKITGAVSTAKAEIKLTTDGISQSVSNIQSDIGTGAVGEVGTIKSSISAVDQKADSIKQTVSSLDTKVTGQGTRLSNAETTIDQHSTSINLKANATDVYKKTDVDTALGKKVDTTTYNNKMSAIDVSINGINQTVSNQKTTIDNLTGTVTGHTSQISTIDQKADEIELRVAETEGNIDGLSDRVGSAETKITANTTAINLKASQESVNAIDGRVSTAEGQIEVQAGQISQRVTKTDFDSAVGVNKWIASKYVITGTDLTTTPPTFPLLREKQASEVKEIVDNIAPAVFTGTGVITHLFTNVYLQTAKTISLSVKYDDSVGIYVNGAKVYENKYNAMAVVSVSMSLRAGWNTIEILHGLKDGTAVLNLGTTLSTQVDKMTTVIGVGDKNETRLTQAESAIVQTEKSIQLKANATDVTNIGNRVTATEGSITVLNNAITSKVSQTDFNAYNQRVSNAESTIEQLSDQITQKVSQTDYDELNDRVDSAETTIAQHADSIALKVAQTDFDGLKGRVSNAETQITANKNAIALKASQSSLDTVSGRLTTAEGKLTVASDQIATKVSKTEFDSLQFGGRNLLTGTSQIFTASLTGNTFVSTSGELQKSFTRNGEGLLLEQGQVYTIQFEYEITNYKSGVGFGLGTSTSVGGYTADTFQTMRSYENYGGAKGKVTYTFTYNNSQVNYLAFRPMKIQSGNDGNTMTITITKLKVEKGNKSTDYTSAPEDVDTQITSLDNRITQTETSITQTNESITLKANKTDVYTKTETNTELAKKANQTDVTAVTSTVNDMSSDLKLTSLEKQALKRDWDRIKAEYAQVLANAQVSTVAVSTTAFTNAYNAIVNTTPKIEAEVLANMSTTYTFASTTARDAFRTQFSTYFTELEKIRKAINDKVNSTANTANSTANTLKNDTIPALATRVSNAESAITQTTSDISLMVRKTEFDALQIGGRNRALKTSSPVVATGFTGVDNYCPSLYKVLSDGFSVGNNVTVSFDFTYEGLTADTSKSYNIYPQGSGNVTAWNAGQWTTFSLKELIDWSTGTGKIKVVYSFKVSSDQMNNASWGLNMRCNYITGGKFTVSNFKVEVGDKASDWTPAPEDVTAETAQAVSDAKAEIKLTTDGISQTVSNLSKTVSDQGTTISGHSSSITSMNTAIGLKASATELTTVKGVISNFDPSIINPNPIFLDWTGTYPAGFAGSANMGTGSSFSKVTSSNGMGNSLKYVVGAGANAYLNPNAVSNIPYSQYVTMEVTFMLESGGIGGAGILFRYEATTDSDQRVHLKDLAPSPTLGKWTTVTKVIKLSSATAMAGFTGYSTFIMGGWTSFGTVEAKTIQFDSVKIRPSTEQEIKAYELDKTIVPALGTRLTTAEGNISVQATQIASKVSTTELSDKLANLVLGNRNLLRHTDFTNDLYMDEWIPYNSNSALGKTTPVTFTSGETMNFMQVKSLTGVAKGIQFGLYSPYTMDLVKGKQYTVSFLIARHSNTSDDIGFTYMLNSANSNQKLPTTAVSSMTPYGTFDGNFNLVCYQYSVTFTASYTDKAQLLIGSTTTSDFTGTTSYGLMFVSKVKVEGGDTATPWVTAVEDLNDSLNDLSIRLSNAEQVIDEDSITATVTNSVSFANALASKADSESLADYVTNDALGEKIDETNEDVDGRIKNAVDNIDLETYEQFSSLKQTTSDITANFTSAGGVNLIKNSVGFAGFDFWAKSGNLEIRQNAGLDALGFGSGFFADNGKSGYVEQVVNVNPAKTYTLSFLVDKTVGSSTNGWAGCDVYEADGTKLTFAGPNTTTLTTGFESYSYTFRPSATTIKIRVTIGASAVATVTGVMLNVGDSPLQWTMAHGEIYNTNVRFDMKGIKVAKIEDDLETRFTVMTPDKFAGYYDVNGDGVIDSNDGSPDEVFRMNEDSFVMKKAVVKEEVSMGDLKIIKISTSTNKGWAFIPSDS